MSLIKSIFRIFIIVLLSSILGTGLIYFMVLISSESTISMRNITVTFLLIMHSSASFIVNKFLGILAFFILLLMYFIPLDWVILPLIINGILMLFFLNKKKQKSD